MATKKLRAGLVGLGMMGRHHARILGSLDGVELVAVSDPMGDPHGVAGGREVFTSVSQLIKAGIDYAMVAAPTAFHEELALELASAGIHALVEKPLAVDTPAAQKIYEAFKAKGLVGAVGHIERYNPALQQLRLRFRCRRAWRGLPNYYSSPRTISCTHCRCWSCERFSYARY